MNDVRTVELLNRLIAILYRSLPMYLRYASPWRSDSSEPVWNTVEHILIDQDALVARAAELVQELGAQVQTGEFPMEFTGMHDLALDFLLQRLIHYQRRDLERLQQLAQQAVSNDIDRRARDLVQEALGSARAHLEILEELARSGHPPGDGAPSRPSAQPASHAH
jgi:hypothetical protein